MPRRAVVVGGSVGGLFAAVSLRDAGWDVHVCERSARTLEDRGAGLVMQPEVSRFLSAHGVDCPYVLSEGRQYLSADGGVKYREHFKQKMTSWDALYKGLLAAFPKDRYHAGARAVGLKQRADGVTLCLENGTQLECDMMVGADGVSSACRRYLLPGTEPRYANYVAWRGVVDEASVDAETAAVFENKFTFFQSSGTHILCYTIPAQDGDVRKGKRRFNWVWYWNVPVAGLREVMTDAEGVLRDFFVESVSRKLARQQKERAAKVLPQVFSSLVRDTERMFLQPIYDVSSPRMAFGRMVLTGDAAFTVRPHTGAGTSKAAKNARELVEAVGNGGDRQLEEQLRVWAEAQVQYGFYLEGVGKAVGEKCQFGKIRGGK